MHLPEFNRELCEMSNIVMPLYWELRQKDKKKKNRKCWLSPFSDLMRDSQVGKHTVSWCGPPAAWCHFIMDGF